MTKIKQKQPTWTDVKEVLSGMRPEELINTINDLYKLRPENKNFLQIRYRLIESPLDDYKKKILNAINPTGNTKISFKIARQAVDDYKNATGDPEGVAELMVYYCEECAASIKSLGLWEQYANGTMNIWRDTLRHIQKLPQQQYIEFWERLAIAQRRIGSTGWGVSDYVDDEMFEYSPYAEDDEEESSSPAPREDMW